MTRFGEPATATAIELQSDGRILAGGTVGHLSSDWVLVRYLPNGRLDPSFKGVRSSPGADSLIDDVAIQPDGKIVAVGDTSRKPGGPDYDWLIARYLPNGSLDRSFGRNGYSRTSFGGNDSATSVALLPNGSMIVAGINSRRRHPYRFAVARYGHNGRLDRSFGRRGKATAGFGGATIVQALRVGRDGTIDVAGISGTGTVDNVALAHFTKAGELDPSFGDGGRLLVSSLPPNPSTGAVRFSQPEMTFTPDGDLVTADDAGEDEGGPRYGIDTARFLPNGTRDQRFGAEGLSAVPGAVGGFVTSVAASRGGAVTVLQSGGGATGSGPALTRVTSSGAVDRTFGKNGHARSRFGRADDWSQRLIIGPNGDLFVSGAYAKDLITFKGTFAVTSFDRKGRLRRSFGPP